MNTGICNWLSSSRFLISTLVFVAQVSCATAHEKAPIDFANARYFHIFKDPDKSNTPKVINEIVVLSPNPQTNEHAELTNRNYFEAKNTNPLIRYLIKIDMDKNKAKSQN